MYLDFTTVDELVTAIGSLPLGPAEQVLVTLADAHQTQLAEIVERCTHLQLPIFGGVFPGLIAERSLKERGAVIRVVPLLGAPLVVDLSSESVSGFDSLDVSFDNSPVTGLMFFDCLAPGVADFVNSAYDWFGNQAGYAGAGAGNSQLSGGHCLFANGRIYERSGLLAFIGQSAHIAVGHGWRRFKGPYLASRCHGNEVLELDWQPAAEVYRQALPEPHQALMARGLFSRVAGDFPLGIYMEGCEDVVRDPIASTEEGGLVFVSEVPENSQVYLMHSEADGLLSAARSVVANADLPEGKQADYIFACDCFTRMLFLGDRYQEELDILWDDSEHGVPVEGVVALGEIAGDGETALQVHNKTIVAGLFYD